METPEQFEERMDQLAELLEVAHKLSDGIKGSLTAAIGAMDTLVQVHEKIGELSGEH